ncbi:short-chain dehydrogenase [Streptomyces abyssalis]|uniref:Short-chain dehydrogenase n=1 Tax=Streptomyces abyssalis TaxID=933944 RepID=A0A1E7JGP8_9ACTN|nr:glucose 1-dehydrogenase [Streptomyces abyssalis]OEU85631.1 short-chain dehydrogenase [Streptomyces abyssalis]OEU92904.1 short-chain dehydrogenase [Streptomyces abyssalis]OEV30531.1 short-chain dehydrogenase [Streptomyces nanshensis]
MTPRHGLLRGKVALITGASSGIGAAAARVFAREGADVVLAARREDRIKSLAEELRSEGARAEYAVCDVTRAQDTVAAVECAVDRFGGLDVAFNNAGFGVGRTPLHEMGDDLYDQIMDVNVRGVWNCLQAEISAMLAAGTGGALVNNSSVGGLRATPVAAPYVASKHAVIGLTKAAAAEYADRGIRVNSVAPGTTRTEVVGAWFDAHPDMEAALHQATPQARTAEPSEIAEAAAWLCSDRASFVTGATMPVDGGFTMV